MGFGVAVGGSSVVVRFPSMFVASFVWRLGCMVRLCVVCRPQGFGGTAFGYLAVRVLYRLTAALSPQQHRSVALSKMLLLASS